MEEVIGKDRSILYCPCTANVALRDEQGEYIRITERSCDSIECKRAEEKIKAHLKEKEVLLCEIHHRVRNNLQIMSSLLSMQARATDNKEAFNILAESRNRIDTMALIHTELYESGNLSEINMNGFLDKLLLQLFHIHSVQDKKITPLVQAVDCSLPISIALPVGLIANELLTNAFKHAFVGITEGYIEVSLRTLENGAIGLIVSDNGIGLPEGFDINAIKTFGLRVVKILVEDQLEGNLEICSDNGATFKVDFEMVKE